MTLTSKDVLKMVEATHTPAKEALAALEVAAASCLFTQTGDIELAKAYIAHVGKFHELLGV